MSHPQATRRQFLAGATTTLGALALGRPAHAKGSVTAAMYPGTWEEAYRAHVLPALKKAHDVDLEMTPLFAVDQIATAQAARGGPPFDAFVLDPGPRVTGIDRGLFEKFDAKRLTNLAKLPAGMADEWGVTVAAQAAGTAPSESQIQAMQTVIQHQVFTEGSTQAFLVGCFLMLAASAVIWIFLDVKHEELATDGPEGVHVG